MMYDADYFLRGKEIGVSLYEDYRWLPELTIPMAKAIATYLRFGEGRIAETILDYGCARGYLVKAFRQLGYDTHGTDASEWAITNCDLEVVAYVNCHNIPTPTDWIIAKDVLEHIPQCVDTITHMLGAARIGVFAVIPLSNVDGYPYVVPDYEKDVTHIHRLTLATWVSFFIQPGWEVTASYCIPGIKDNYASWKNGNGFITARRICQ